MNARVVLLENVPRRTTCARVEDLSYASSSAVDRGALDKCSSAIGGSYAYTRALMMNAKFRGATVATVLVALLVLLVVLPAAISLANGDGAVCFTTSGCPLSAVDPCVRKPPFAVVGRCAVAIK